MSGQRFRHTPLRIVQTAGDQKSRNRNAFLGRFLKGLRAYREIHFGTGLPLLWLYIGIHLKIIKRLRNWKEHLFLFYFILDNKLLWFLDTFGQEAAFDFAFDVIRDAHEHSVIGFEQDSRLLGDRQREFELVLRNAGGKFAGRRQLYGIAE